MALNEETKFLIRAVIKDQDMRKAKQYAKSLCEREKATCNQSFCNEMKSLLESKSLNMMELPSNIQGMLLIEDVQTSFNPNRYYVSEREQGLSQSIFAMNSASALLREAGVNYLNATLLYGESGTGKTELGRYLAYKLDLPFAYVQFSNLVNSYMGDTQKNLTRVFEQIEKAPCVFMLDEIDAIGMERGTSDRSSASAERNNIVITLMQCLDRLRSDVILLGATNRYNCIDDALKRRFPLHHKVKIFTPNEIAAMLKAFITDVNTRSAFKFQYNDADLTAYSATNLTQAKAINGCIQAMASAILTKSPLKFPTA